MKTKELKPEQVKLALPQSTAPSGVVINELMAANTKSVKDPQGEFEDWIELANTTDKPIDLNGMYLSDSSANPKKWQFPQSAKIPAGGYLVLWADDDTEATSGYHLNFKLSASGEELYLVDRDDRNNMVLDTVKFEKQTEGISFGRHPRAREKFTPCAPTPGTANRTGE